MLRLARHAISLVGCISEGRFGSETIVGLRTLHFSARQRSVIQSDCRMSPANDTTFESNPLPETLASRVRGLATGSRIENSTFDVVNVGNGVQLSNVVARGTVIPSDIVLSNWTLGVPSRQAPSAVPKPLFEQITTTEYSPGAFTPRREETTAGLGKPATTCPIT